MLNLSFVEKCSYKIKDIFDSENVTCITYMGTHGMSRQTKYHVGEKITVKYNLENPKKHEILNDKDKMFAYKGFKIAGSLIMLVPLILVIISFFYKGLMEIHYMRFILV